MMHTPSPSNRWLAAGFSAALFGVIVALIALRPPVSDHWDNAQAAGPNEAPKAAAPDKIEPPAKTNAYGIFGGTLQRNMVNTTDTNVPSEWEVVWKPGKGVKEVDLAKSKNIKWAVKLGTCSYGGPVAFGGKVFVGTNNGSPRNPKIVGDKGNLMCFAEADGKYLWEAIHDKLASGQVNDYPKQGVCSAPYVEGDRLYYVNNRCEVVCADVNGDPQTHEPKYIWKLDMMKELNVFPHNLAACSPLCVGDLLYVVTANGVDEDHLNIPSPLAPSFIAINKKDGKVVWKDSSPGKKIMHGQWSNPAYAPASGTTKAQVIFPGGDGWLYSFEPETGKLVWKYDCNPKDSKYELGGKGTKSDFIGTPVIVGNHCFIGTGQDPEHYEGIGHLWCIDITKTGDVSPELVTDESVFPPKTKPNPNSAKVWHFGGAVPKEDREKIGRDYYFGRTMSTVAVHGDLLYAGELAGYLHCIDAKTGKELWSHDLKAALWGSPYWVDDKVYIATEDGDVWIFKDGKVKAEPKKIEMEQPVRSTPIVHNGVLYIMTETYLYAIAHTK